MSTGGVYLVTGATGVVGSAIVARLLREPGIRVHVLMRAPSDEALDTRVRALLEFWSDRLDGFGDGSRLFPVRGDVTRPLLGMNEQSYAALAGSVTHVIHAAGDVKLNQSIEQARASTLIAATEVMRFARACRSSGRAFPKIEHLSTVGVAGRRPGLIPEEPLDSRFGYHNTYEQAKAETEALLRQETNDGLPVTLHRPSMVVGDSRDGRVIHFQVFYHLIRFIAGSRTRGWLPNFGDVRLDLVPSDYVAEAVIASSRRSESTGRIFHLCSGPEASIPLAELGAALRKFLSEQGEWVARPKFVPPWLMRGMIHAASHASTGHTRRALQALPHFVAYLQEQQYFANDAAREFFRAEQIDPPATERFLAPVLEYWYGHGLR